MARLSNIPSAEYVAWLGHADNTTDVAGGHKFKEATWVDPTDPTDLMAIEFGDGNSVHVQRGEDGSYIIVQIGTSTLKLFINDLQGSVHNVDIINYTP